MFFCNYFLPRIPRLSVNITVKHKLSNINKINKTATCSVCGPNTPIDFRGPYKDGFIRQQCLNRKRERDNEYALENPEWRKCFLGGLLFLSEEDKNKSLNGDKCEICGISKQNNKKNLSRDHCHKSNLFRGMLCNRCNSGLGLFLDSTDLLEKAISYLNSFNKRKTPPFDGV